MGERGQLEKKTSYVRNEWSLGLSNNRSATITEFVSSRRDPLKMIAGYENTN